MLPPATGGLGREYATRTSGIPAKQTSPDCDMNAAEAKQFIVAHVIVQRSDVADAKQHLLGLTGKLDIGAIAKARADEVVGHSEQEMPLWQSDPTPSLLLKARHIGAQLAIFKAAWELTHNGVMLLIGETQVAKPSVLWSTVRPGGSGYRSGEDLEELQHSYPSSLLRPAWISDVTTLTDADLYLRALDASGVHTGIAEALRQAVRAFAIGLFVPAVAMLDAASEGAWVETGRALSVKSPTDIAGAKLTATLDDPRSSMRAKAAKICDYYDNRKDIQKKAGVPATLLRETQLWSVLVRDARNVLHWNVTAAIPNDYAKVSTLLLGALNHIKRLHVVTTA